MDWLTDILTDLDERLDEFPSYNETSYMIRNQIGSTKQANKIYGIYMDLPSREQWILYCCAVKLKKITNEDKEEEK